MALPLVYERTFDRTLEEVALAAVDLDVPLVPFWPLRGAGSPTLGAAGRNGRRFGAGGPHTTGA